MEGQPRQQHYLFAHVALRQVAFKHGAVVIAMLASDEGSSIWPELWDDVYKQLSANAEENDEPVPEPMAMDGFGVDVRRMDDRMIAIITLPPAEAPVEAHMAAVISEPLQAALDTGAQPSDVPVRYFTLERGITDADGSPRTVLCEWGADGEHLNYGDGPPADVNAFTHAALQVCLRQE